MIKERKILPPIQKHLEDKRHTIITGARQVGKTSLLKILFRQLKAANKKVFLLSFEDRRILEAVDEHPEKIFTFIPEIPIPSINKRAEEKIYLLIDEVQYTEAPTNFLKYIYDKYVGNVKLVVTGSSAFYMDKKFTDSLAGRKRIFDLYPLSFDEFLAFKGADESLEELNILRSQPTYQSSELEKLTNFFYEYLTYGGYPAVVLENDVDEKKFLLEELKNAYVKRDILESGVSNEGKFYLLLQILADQVGNLVNKFELGKSIQLDAKTVDSYLHILQKCYHIYLLRPFFKNIRKELTKMPKVFFNDIGLRNSFLNRFGAVPTRADKGELLENYYFLLFRQKYSTDQIKFWRTSDQNEIDFIIEESFGEGKAFEIKWNAANFKLSKYKKFTDHYPTFPLACLSTEDFFHS